jgi:hypothetical protein
MGMIKSSVLFLCVAVSTAFGMNGPGQQNGRSITIRLNSPTTFQEHISYIITDDGKEGLLTRHKNDKVEFKKVTKNKAYPVQLKKKQNILLLTAEQQYRIWDKVDSLYDVYSHRTTSKIKIAQHTDAQYFKMLDSIYAAPDAVFTAKNPRRVLDGLYYQVTVKNNGKQKRYYVNTPNNQLHPLLSRLMARTSALLKVNTPVKTSE